MAKTVKIPDNMSPWKATINGIDYVYPAGTTQEVPDEVAALIERISNVQPEKEPNMPPFAGGAQADMNAAEGEPGHVLNRTHWVEYAELLPPTVAIPSGSETGEVLIASVIEGVSAGGTYTVNYNGTNYECVGEDLSDLMPDAVILGDFGVFETGEPTGTHPFCMMVLSPDAAAERGVGAMVLTLDGASSVTVSISGEIVHKLDPKFLPDGSGVFTLVLKATATSDNVSVFSKNATYPTMLDKVLYTNALVQAKLLVYVNADDAQPVMCQAFYYGYSGVSGSEGYLSFFSAHNSTTDKSFMLQGFRFYESGGVEFNS